MTFGTWDPLDIWSEWCQDKKDKKITEGQKFYKNTDRKKERNTKTNKRV